MNESEPRVTIVSAGQLSACPRMVKAADALYAEGYRVRVVMNRRADWASQSDGLVEAERPWLDVTTIDERRSADTGASSTFWPFWIGACALPYRAAYHAHSRCRPRECPSPATRAPSLVRSSPRSDDIEAHRLSLLRRRELPYRSSGRATDERALRHRLRRLPPRRARQLSRRKVPKRAHRFRRG